MPRCRRRPILAPTYQTSGGALLCTSKTLKPVASRSKVGGATEVYLLFAIQLAFKRAFYTISGASSMMARKRLVWRHFIVDFTNTVFAKCQLCQKSIS